MKIEGADVGHTVKANAFAELFCNQPPIGPPFNIINKYQNFGKRHNIFFIKVEGAVADHRGRPNKDLLVRKFS